MNVITPSCSMKAMPAESSKLETECLFGETVEVIDSHLDWLYCKLLTDDYCGWVKRKDLGEILISTHRVISKNSFLYVDNDPKSHCIHYLPLGAQLSIEKIEGHWAKVCLYNNFKYKFAFVPSKHIVKIDNKLRDWVGIAELLIGTPYKWGGRDTLGLDCSALLQLAYQTYGENISRNTIDQIKIKKKVVTNYNNLNRGFVIFWNGHVGIMVDKYNCIHSNGFHMKTIIEPLSIIVDRIGKKNPVIKVMNFN